MYTLTLALRSSDVAPPPKGVELSAAGVEAARRNGDPSLVVDLTPGHARAVLQDGFGRAGLARIVAVAMAENRASIHVMEKLAMKYERQMMHRGFEVVLYAVDRPGQ